MKRIAMAVVVVAIMMPLLYSCSGGATAESQALPVVQVGQSYRVLVGMGAMRFKVLEVGKGGLVKVQAVDDGSFAGIHESTVWWLNLSQAVLIEAK